MLSDKAYVALTVAAAVVFTVLTILVGLRWWVGPALCVPVIVAGLLVKHRLENNRLYAPAAPSSYPQSPPPPPAPPASTRVQGLVLPSRDRDYRFLLYGTVLWRHSAAAPAGGQHPRQDQLAIDAIRERATRHTQDEPAGDFALVGSRLAADLSYPAADRSGELEVWAHDVVLSIPEADLQRLNKLADLRKDEEVWEHERDRERNIRAYLRDDVFMSTGSAVVWWLSQDTTKVDQAVALIGALAKLTAAANDREVDPVFRAFVDAVQPSSTIGAAGSPAQLDLDDGRGVVESVRWLIAEAMPHGTEPDRAHMADQLATLVATMGADDAAQEIRQAFNAPNFADDPDADDPDAGDPRTEEVRTAGLTVSEAGNDGANGAPATPMSDATTAAPLDHRPHPGFSEN